MADRLHLTIGEVLSLLQQEFPDVSISKIRFLESQGLVDPERTPSGYRKFYDHDVERLRWILRQQREHFLPLKVIRGRLSDGEAAEAGADGDTGASPIEGVGAAASAGEPVTPSATAAPPATPSPATPPPATVAGPPAGTAPAGARVSGAHDPEVGSPAPVPPAPSTPPATAANALPPRRPEPDPAPGGTGRSSTRSEPAPAGGAAPTAAPSAVAAAEVTRPAAASRPVAAAGRGARQAERAAPAATASRHPDVYSAAELAAEAGCTTRLVAELAQYGILNTDASVGGVAYYGAEALALARVGARFAELGVEPRHLRPWRNAAEREAGLFEQLIMPLLRQRNPAARQQAGERLAELTQLGADLRAGLIAEAVRHIH